MAKFLFVNHGKTDPYFNIACEEYLLKKKDGFYISVWQNEPAVIVGINQNALLEVNLSYAQKNGIKVVRRITGGGAVYHDLNNICYTVIAPYNTGEDGYKKFTLPVIEYLATFGVKAKFSGRNDVLVDEKKVSGTAETVYKDRIMHHGTLLFDSDMEMLSASLNASKLKVESKGIKSVKSRVTNIKEHIGNGITCDDFKRGLCDFLKKDAEEYVLTKEDYSEIEKLIKEKYSTYQWNIGYSPKGKNKIEDRFSFGIFALNFDIVNGIIQNAEISGDFFTKKDIKDFAKNLNGVKWEKEALYQAFIGIEDYISGATKKEIVDKIFE